MTFSRAGQHARTVIQWSLAASLFVACSRMDATEQIPPAAKPEPSTQALAASPPTASPAVGSLQPAQPGPDRLDTFAQGLARTLDPSRMSTRPASAAGGTLHIPNGYAAHAAIVVRNPDGTLKTTCVSSAAEVSALVKQIRSGAGQ